MADRQKPSRPDSGAETAPPSAAPLRGMGAKLAPGMQTYLVSFRPAEDSETPVSRSQLYSAGVAKSQEFRKELLQQITKLNLDDEVQTIGEPMVFPMLGLTCTAEAAEKISKISCVESVVADQNDLRSFASGAD